MTQKTKQHRKDATHCVSTKTNATNAVETHCNASLHCVSTTTKRFASLLIALLLAMLLPHNANAQYGAGSFSLSTGSGYTYGSNTLTINQNGTYTISMITPNSTTNDRIAVQSGLTDVNITLNGVSIDVSATNNACAFDAAGTAVNVTLLGTNTLISGYERAGINIPSGAVLTITNASTGELTATGGSGSAGIGCNRTSNGGTVIINGGTVTANGGYDGAGIGSGEVSTCNAITISGGVVTANGSMHAAGIGGGALGRTNNITISGGIVTAVGSYSSYGVIRHGVGIGGSGGTIDINGGIVTASSGNQGIGRGFYHDNTATITLNMNGNAVVFTPSIGNVNTSGVTKGILFIGSDTGKFYGTNVTPTDSLYIPAGKILKIPDTSTFTISMGKSLTNDGIINNYGIFDQTGSIINNGNINHAVYFSSIDTNGSLSAEVDNIGIVSGDLVEQTNTVVFTATPDGGYSVREWKDNNTAVNGANTVYTLSNLAAVHTVSVEFETTPPFCGGAGTELNPFLICTAGQLDSVRYYLNRYFKLNNNIDLTDFLNGNTAGWLPIGSTSTPFSGTFDGDNKTVSGLYINATATDVGLFGNIQTATIKNLNVVNANITSTNGSVGIISGYLRSGKIENCTSSGTVNATTNSGGIVGYVRGHATVENCQSTATVITSGNNGGGIVGNMVETTTAATDTIRNCTFTGTVTVEGTGGGGIAGNIAYALIENCNSNSTITVNGTGSGNYTSSGGIAGYSTNSTIENCYANGSVTAVGNAGGGIAGQFGNGAIRSCYNLATVHCDLDAAGGIVGNCINGENGTVENCYSMGKITGRGYLGGIGGHVRANYTLNNCYATGAIESVGTTTQVNLGGIAGNLNGGTISNCAALNLEITTPETSVGRIAGNVAGGYTLTNNVAWEDMPLNNDTITDGLANNKDGLNVSKYTINYNASGDFGDIFAAAPWTKADLSLPGLFGQTVSMPAHLMLPTYAVIVNSGTGSGNYTAGATVTITANAPPAGQQFKEWTTESAGVSFADFESATTTFTMPDNAVTVTATYEAIPTYAVTVNSGTGSGNYIAGATVIITANTPPAGQQFKEWTTESAGVSFADFESAITTFTMPAHAVAVTATYEAIPANNHLITVTVEGNGIANANVQSAPQGEVITLTATPNSGHQFAEWQIINGGITLSSTTATTATFTMPNNAVSVKAIFEAIPPPPHTVTFNTQGGSNVPSQTVAHGALATEPTPAPTLTNHIFEGWFKEAACTNAWNFATDRVTQDTTLYAKWTEETGIAVETDNYPSLQIYPNPTQNELTITSEALQITRVEICDLAGRVVQFGQPQGSPLQINVSALPAGIYLVKIHTEKGIVTRKVVKN